MGIRISSRRFCALALLAMTMVFVSCGTKKAVVSGGLSGDMQFSDNEMQKQVFLQKVRSNAEGSNNITSKIDFTLKAGDKDISLAGSLSMRKDDVIRIQLTPYGIMEVGRLEFTKDYVLIMDRINKQYVKADYNQLDFLRDNGLDFYALQSLFWNELFQPGTQKLTDSSLKNYSVDIRERLSDIVFNKGKMQYRWIADSKTGLINSLNVEYDGKQDGQTSVNCDYSAFKAVGTKQFPTAISMRFATTATKEAHNAGFILKLKSIGTNSDWESRTNVSGKYKEVSVEELLKLLMSL